MVFRVLASARTSRIEDIWHPQDISQIPSGIYIAMDHLPFFAVVTEAISFLRMVPHLFIKDLYVFSSNLFLRYSSSNQYSVSKLSFNAISNLLIKSALLCAYFAS